MMSILMSLRRILSNYWVTSNTIRYRIELRAILNCLKSIPVEKRSGTLVDLGAGSGEMSRRLSFRGQWTEIIGIEPDPTNYHLLEKNWRSFKQSKTIQGSLLDIPLPDQSVDWVLSTQVLEHIPDDQKAASEIHRILKPNGYAIISVPHPPEIFPNPGHIRPGYNLEQLKSLFTPYSMKMIEHDYFFTLKTLRQLSAIEEFSFLRYFNSLTMIDYDLNTTFEQRRDSQPYGITVLFKKI